MGEGVSVGKFRDDEVVQIAVGQTFPKIGGRLRLMHETNETVTMQSEIITNTPDLAIIRGVVTLKQGTYDGLGSANIKDDKRLAGSLLELAQTRAMARALRFAGYGVETCGIEELRGESAPEERDEEAGHADIKWTAAMAMHEMDGMLNLPELAALWKRRNKTWKEALSATDWASVQAKKDEIKANMDAANKEAK